MAEVLKTLKGKRKARVGIVTRIKNEFTSNSNPNRAELEASLSSLIRYKHELSAIDDQIVEIHDKT